MQVDILDVLRTLSAAHHLQLTQVQAPFSQMKHFDYGLRCALDPQLDWEQIGRQLLAEARPQAILLAEDVFEMEYAVFALPDAADTAYILGPWVSGQRSEAGQQWCSTYLGASNSDLVSRFYDGVCRLNGASVCATLSALLSLTGDGTVEVKQSKSFRPLVFEPDLRCFREPAFERNLPAAMLERRYAAETAVTDAVEKGDAGQAITAFEQLVQFRMESRFATPQQDVRMILTILNVLLRKAIQRSEVHPYYIDKISGRYAVRIDGVADAAEGQALALEMLREYCAYVQKYSLKKFSPLVQKVINYIQLNLSGTLSLKHLAGVCYISPSYLSYLFKQETGQTLTDYINTCRVERAAKRLRTTGDSVAEIAESVGVLDVNYFTKIFKKSMGVTPTAYRKSQNR